MSTHNSGIISAPSPFSISELAALILPIALLMIDVSSYMYAKNPDLQTKTVIAVGENITVHKEAPPHTARLNQKDKEKEAQNDSEEE